MIRSHGFVFKKSNYIKYLRILILLATFINLPTHNAKGTLYFQKKTIGINLLDFKLSLTLLVNYRSFFFIFRK